MSGSDNIPTLNKTPKKSPRWQAVFMTLLGLSLLVLSIGYSLGVMTDRMQPADGDAINTTSQKNTAEKEEAKTQEVSKKKTNNNSNAKKNKRQKHVTNKMLVDKRKRRHQKNKDNVPPYIKTVPIALGSHDIFFTATGRIIAKNTLTVNSDVAGEVISLSPNLEAGELVKEGDVLAKIDPTSLSRQLTAAKARLAQAQANLLQEQARSKQAKIDLKRSGIRKPSALALRQPQLASAKANISSINAEIADLEKDLKNVTIKSPINGMVLNRKAQLGNRVGQTSPIAELIDIDLMTVAIALSKQELLWLGTDAILEQRKVLVTLDEAPQQRWTASLRRLSPQVDVKTQSLTVFADLPKPYATVPASQTLLRIGSAVNVKFTGRSVSNSVWVDTAAIQQGKFVWTVDRDNKLQRANLTIIKTSGDDNKQSLVTFPLNTSVNNYVPKARTSFTKGLLVSTTLPQTTTEKKSNKKAPKNNSNTQTGSLNAE